MTFQKPVLFPFSGKGPPNMMDPVYWAIHNHWAP